MATYKVILTGVRVGLTVSEVAPRLALLCKIPVEGATALLASPSMVIKGALDPNMAAEYKEVLQRVGCNARIEKEDGATGTSAPRSAAQHVRAAFNAQRVQRQFNVVARQVKNMAAAVAGSVRRYAAQASERASSDKAATGKPQSFFAAVTQSKAAGPQRIAARRSRKSVLSVPAIIASVVVTTVAVAGYFMVTSSSSGGPCPGEYDPVRWTNCVGEVSFPNGERYVGALKDGQPHGQGTLTWPNKEKYVGEWRDGRRNGYGTFTWPDGTKYVGEYRNDKKHGQGTQTFPNGRTYVGEFKDGSPIKQTMQR